MMSVAWSTEHGEERDKETQEKRWTNRSSCGVASPGGRKQEVDHRKISCLGGTHTRDFDVLDRFTGLVVDLDLDWDGVTVEEELRTRATGESHQVLPVHGS